MALRGDNERKNQQKNEIITFLIMGQGKDLSPTEENITKAIAENTLGSTSFVLTQCNSKKSCCNTQMF